jgi:transcriptional regulator with XRE-family HTH domain
MLEIGRSLREARDRRGLELAEVEAATLIRRRYLEALEQERFELLPGGSYRRTFLREYAEFLGLDGESFAAEYDLRLAAREPEPPSPSRRPSIGVLRLLGESLLTRTVAVAAAVVLAGVALWQLGGSGGTGVVKATHPATQTHAETHAHHPAATVQPSRRPSPLPLLTLNAVRGRCWLSVRIGSRSGRTVYEQTLQEGQTVRFGLRKMLWIRFGAPWNLDATIGSRQVTGALPSRTGDIFATSSGLRPSP